MTITDAYRFQLLDMHASRQSGKRWGTTGERNAGMEIVRCLTGRGDIKTVLDFGSGQGSLGRHVVAALPYLSWTNYDPGIPDCSRLPERSFDFIVSSDVLEHVEPELVGETVAWMQAHARKGMFHHIACDPAGLLLPDGRNAHLTCRPPGWWREKFESPEWSLMYFADCVQRKRGGLRQHCQIQLDRVGG